MKRKDPKREFPFEADTIAEKITETANEGTLFEEMYISRNTFVNMLWVSQKGAYVFVPLMTRTRSTFCCRQKR